MTRKNSCAARCKVGDVFGKLTVVSADGPRSVDKCHCVCECGEKCSPQRHALLSGNSTSCGCLRWLNRATHNMSKTPEHQCWCSMRRRCENKSDKDYRKYGGRGIKVCKRWRDFAKFYADMGPKPSSAHSLGRRNNNRGYTPANCRWETFAQQQVNKTNNLMITARGITLAASSWSRITGISANTIRGRKHNGWSDEDAVSVPVRHRNVA